MANRLFTKIFGTRFDRELKRIQPIVDAIKQHEVRLKDLSDSELQAQTAKFRERIAERLPGNGGPAAESPDVTATIAREIRDRQPTLPAESVTAVVGPRLGAGLVVSGTITRTGRDLTMNARLVDVESGKTVANITELTGSADSQSALLDRLVAGLLAQRSGGPPAEVARLAALPLPADPADRQADVLRERAGIRPQPAEHRQGQREGHARDQQGRPDVF